MSHLNLGYGSFKVTKNGTIRVGLPISPLL